VRTALVHTAYVERLAEVRVVVVVNVPEGCLGASRTEIWLERAVVILVVLIVVVVCVLLAALESREKARPGSRKGVVVLPFNVVVVVVPVLISKIVVVHTKIANTKTPRRGAWAVAAVTSLTAVTACGVLAAVITIAAVCPALTAGAPLRAPTLGPLFCCRCCRVLRTTTVLSTTTTAIARALVEVGAVPLRRIVRRGELALVLERGCSTRGANLPRPSTVSIARPGISRALRAAAAATTTTTTTTTAAAAVRGREGQGPGPVRREREPARR
jgi:hypothetical protein